MYMYTCNKGHHDVMMMSHHVIRYVMYVALSCACACSVYNYITHCCAVVLANSTQHLVQQSDRVFNLVNKFIIQTYHHHTLPASPPMDHELIIPSFVITLQRDMDIVAMATLQELTVSIDLLPVHKMEVCACTEHTLAMRHTLLTERPLNLIDCRECDHWKLYELDTY